MIPNGPFGNSFPYTNFHSMNLDWVIQIAKDFLDQYTQIQDTIDQGLQDLTDKANDLEELLQAWYNTHSEDIATQLADAIRDLNAWYTEHSQDISNELSTALASLTEHTAEAVNAFEVAAAAKAAEVLETIPDDYTTMGNEVTLLGHIMDGMKTDTIQLEWVVGSINASGANIESTSRLRTAYMLPSNDFNMVYIDLTNAGAFKVFFYNNSDVMVSSSADWETESRYLNLESGAKFKLIAKYQESATLEPSEISNILTVKGITLSSYSKFVRLLDDGSDLDDIYEAGWYQTINLGTYANTPSDDAATGHRVVVVFTTKEPPLNTSYRIMFYYNGYTNYTAIRYFYSGVWHDWKSLQTDTNLGIFSKYNNTLADGSDLDDIYLNGWYETVGAGTYSNAPEPDGTTGARLITCFNCRTTPASDSYRVMTYYNNSTGVYGVRFYYSNIWHEWKTLSLIKNLENNIKMSFGNSAQPNLGDNKGLDMTICSYNVATYKNGTDTYIEAEKIQNLRKFLGKVNPDILVCQEDRQYIDGYSQKTSNGYIYQPVLPKSIGVDYGGCTIRAKARTGNTQGRLAFTQYSTAANHIIYGTFVYDDAVLLMVGIHANWNHAEDGGTSAANQAIRLSQYQDIFQWVNGDADLYTYGSDPVLTHVPDHTHCIICGDFNSATENDQGNLADIAADYDFRLSNGGRFGWFVTHPSNSKGLDNIIVSPNIIINNFDAWTADLADLYSDHVPVTAQVTLLPIT